MMENSTRINFYHKSCLLNNLKKLVFLLFIFNSLTSAYAQDLEYELQIKDFLGLERYSDIMESNPAYLKFLNARCSDGFHIMNYVEEKMNDFPIVEVIYFSEWKSVEINGKDCKEFVQTKITPEEFILATESSDFNFLKYQFNYDRKKVVYYVLGETGKVILIVPTEQINKIVNQEN